MPLAAATRLGPYEIVSPLGAGGMGEVYRARDIRLHRTVAIKVLRPHLSANAVLRARFEREAKTISSLQHAHICVLHDIGKEADTDFLVMEYLEGETLRQQLRRGPMAVRKAVDWAHQIAEGLAAAHDKGIVHRDLKPENISLHAKDASRFSISALPGLRVTSNPVPPKRWSSLPKVRRV